MIIPMTVAMATIMPMTNSMMLSVLNEELLSPVNDDDDIRLKGETFVAIDSLAFDEYESMRDALSRLRAR